MSNCVYWSQTPIQWGKANWLWSVCSGVIPPMPVVSSSFNYGVDATTLVQPWLIEPWNPYTTNDEHDKKRKRLIKLICKIGSQKYEEEKEVGDMKISVGGIKTTVGEIREIGLDVKLEE